MSEPRYKWPLFGLAAAVVVGASVIRASASSPESLPEEWPDKDEFCSQAALLGVGEPGLNPQEHSAVLRQLLADAPTSLKDEFAAISAALEGGLNNLNDATVDKRRQVRRGPLCRKPPWCDRRGIAQQGRSSTH